VEDAIATEKTKQSFRHQMRTIEQDERLVNVFSPKRKRETTEKDQKLNGRIMHPSKYHRRVVSSSTANHATCSSGGRRAGFDATETMNTQTVRGNIPHSISQRIVYDASERRFTALGGHQLLEHNSSSSIPPLVLLQTSALMPSPARPPVMPGDRQEASRRALDIATTLFPQRQLSPLDLVDVSSLLMYPPVRQQLDHRYKTFTTAHAPYSSLATSAAIWNTQQRAKEENGLVHLLNAAQRRNEQLTMLDLALHSRALTRLAPP
jgi:hypothetical protein